MKSSAVIITVRDAKALLQKSFPKARVSINGKPAEIEIRLSPAAIIYKLHKPPSKAFYSVFSEPSKEGSGITVSADTPKAISDGIYGLLRYKLGFRFYHPKDTYIPVYDSWPLPGKFSLTGEALFKDMGFHLHTMHPIELTEPLFNPSLRGGLGEVKQYIDWLARNGQNTFQFWILRTADKSWPGYAAEYLTYAKQRGIRTGAVISLSTLQQKAFQSVRLLKPESYKRQIDQALSWIMRAPFDYFAVDFTMGEFLPDLAALMPSYKKYMLDVIKYRYHREVFETTHVIKRAKSPTPPYAGILIHTVMFYSLEDASAPVYGNKNVKFMLDMLNREKRVRKTWYWPESSYWVTFDTSVPVFLMPYFSARYRDIQLLKNNGADGHVTFTSGWEWGYWMVDYSIARWCWRITEDGKELKTSEDSELTELFGEKSDKLWHKAFLLQQKYLKDDNLITLLSARTPFDELPYPFNKTFQPSDNYSLFRCSFPISGLRNRARAKQRAELLKTFGERFLEVTKEIKSLPISDRNPMKNRLRREILNAMEITGLRALHRSDTVMAGAYRNTRLKGSSKDFYDSRLKEAERIRGRAELIVKNEEMLYRYPLALIARKNAGHTAYDFGYLYPAADLYFWRREEAQAEKGRYDAFFMNIWNFRNTLGLEGLF